MRKILILALLFLGIAMVPQAQTVQAQGGTCPLIWRARDTEGNLVSGVQVELTSNTRFNNEPTWTPVVMPLQYPNAYPNYIANEIDLEGVCTDQIPFQHYFQIRTVSVPEGYEVVQGDFTFVGLCDARLHPYDFNPWEFDPCAGELIPWEIDPGYGEVGVLEVIVRRLPTAATPVLPTVAEAMCTDGVLSDPVVTPAVTEGITYTVTGDVVPGGMVTITATPNEGYELADVVEPYIYDAETGTASYSLTLQNPDCDPVAGTTPDPVDPSPTATAAATETSAATVTPAPTGTAAEATTMPTASVADATTTPTASAVTGLPATGAGSSDTFVTTLLTVAVIGLATLALGTRRGVAR